ncbi:MAG TPA: trypsin-like peptidase domain-containing protein [Jiangellaceae bacterium]|nr:trypsin-like peptidase domain-containing protein [Jiangellaceae bacterium]
MDPTTRDISHPDATPGTGWSTTPGTGSDLPRRDPWTTRPADTGPVPRPTDTRAIPEPSGRHGDAAGEPANPPAGGGHPPTGTQVSEPADSTRIAPPGEPGTGFGTPPPVTPAEDFRATPPARRGTAFLVALALGAGALAGVGGAVVYDTLADDPTATSPSSSLTNDEDTPADQTSAASLDSVEGVAEQVLPSVVSISFGAGGGSGVIISSDGQILTNNHVVEAAGGGEIVVTFQDGSTATAEVIGTDPMTDLAVIQAEGVSDLQVADLGSSADLEVGEQVVAIGSPLGLDGTVTTGIVSAINRPVTAGGQEGGGTPTVFDAIQTDAPINPGNSGGPLVNMAGQVVGINSVIASTSISSGSIGLGFAIPIDQASPIAEELVETGRATHAQIGIGVDNASGELRGALVREVQTGSAAEQAGLEDGDIVTHVDGRLVTDAESLIAAVRSYRPGDDVELTVIRDGETLTVPVTLGSDASST